MIEEPLALPCGATLANRLCKAAMTEGLATAGGVPTDDLNRLYALWSEGGAGLLLSGNVLVDRDHLERPGNVFIDAEPDAAMMEALRAWAAAGTRAGNHFWAQISHAGRQTQKLVNAAPKAPSAVKLGLPGGQFGEPVALTADEIHAVVAAFARCARVVKEAGFTGVQIHAAHGYLLSQFLSPRSNRRSDEWGGSLENRARALLDIVAATREAVGPRFPVAVKLNSADFLRGGFEFTESLQVARWLADAGVDLLEISGGTYEQPKLINLEGIEPVEAQGIAESTRAREAYFVDFAQAMRREISIPLMVTGGLRRRDAMEAAIASGSADLVGIGRPMCLVPDAPRRLLEGVGELPRFEERISLLPPWLRFLQRGRLMRTVGGFATQYWFYEQLVLMARSGRADESLSVLAAARRQLKRASELASAMATARDAQVSS